MISASDLKNKPVAHQAFVEARRMLSAVNFDWAASVAERLLKHGVIDEATLATAFRFLLPYDRLKSHGLHDAASVQEALKSNDPDILVGRYRRTVLVYLAWVAEWVDQICAEPHQDWDTQQLRETVLTIRAQIKAISHLFKNKNKSLYDAATEALSFMLNALGQEDLRRGLAAEQNRQAAAREEARIQREAGLKDRAKMYESQALF